MFTALEIPGPLRFQYPRHEDARGWFAETYNLSGLDERGFPRFFQDNESWSAAVGTVRGLHFQRAPFAQAKLIRCIVGAIFDVAVDIRPGSPTFGRYVSSRLDAAGGAQMLIPTGFAHGFCTLMPGTLVQYKVSAPYAPDHEGGIAWDDPALAIEWPVSSSTAVLSDRDRGLPCLSEARL